MRNIRFFRESRRRDATFIEMSAHHLGSNGTAEQKRALKAACGKRF